MPAPLPIHEVLPRLLDSLAESCTVILAAPPGAGKTTVVPLALREAPWVKGKKIIILEPRRLAARRAAEFMAGTLGETVGDSVGYRIRGEARVGRSTQVEVVTEGILTRLLQSDPGLENIGAIVFDEFHERSIHADLGLALSRDVQTHLRKDLRILIMSATLPSEELSARLDGAPVVSSQGKQHSVTTRYLDRQPTGAVERNVVDGIMSGLRIPEGDVLVFLPGQREIRRVESLLGDRLHDGRVRIVPLFGELPFDQQQDALRPAGAGIRKVILATSIAETSLTIDGVRIVVDSGLARSARFDPRRGMTGLVTGPVSVATADQRRGRAGRQGPGVCFRIWSEAQHSTLPAFPRPEIMTADLASFLLECSCWGAPEGEGLHFLDRPPSAHLRQARSLLVLIGAIDDRGRATAHGKFLVQFPLHPRLAHMIFRGKEHGIGPLACEVAALLEFGIGLMKRKDPNPDLHSQIAALRSGVSTEPVIRQRIEREIDRLRTLAGISGEERAAGDPGQLLALAYPDRIARRRPGGKATYLMVNGAGASLPSGAPLARHEFLAIGDADGQSTDARIYLGSPLSKQQIRDLFHGEIIRAEEIYWDPARECVVARVAEKLGEVVIDEKPLPPSDVRISRAMAEGVKGLGLSVLPWETSSEELRLRSEWARTSGLVPEGWPDLGDEALLAGIFDWLTPFLSGVTKRSQLDRLEMSDIVKSFFRHDQRILLDTIAPATVRVPTGSNIRLVYSPGSIPVLSVRLQEMFGQVETPRVGGGKIPVVVHLLSPAQRPLAVTQDLRNFWRSVYPEVRKEMRGRYPRHIWPEDPLSAAPTRRTRKRDAGN
jgi:ATP-dependent helicase HrpB